MERKLGITKLKKTTITILRIEFNFNIPIQFKLPWKHMQFLANNRHV